SDLLPSLKGLKDRPWNRESPISAQKLATLLHDYGVGPRLQRIGKDRTARGYRLQDFQSAWQRFLNAEIANNDAACNTVTPRSQRAASGEAVSCSDRETDVDSVFTSSSELEATSFFCNTVTPSGDRAASGEAVSCSDW